MWVVLAEVSEQLSVPGVLLVKVGREAGCSVFNVFVTAEDVSCWMVLLVIIPDNLVYQE